MLTTARKIEIAEAVMNDPRLCNRTKSYFFGIHTALYYTKTSYSEYLEMAKEFINYFKLLYNKDVGLYEEWFNIDMPEARTERIEFLSKYIEHLKKEL